MDVNRYINISNEDISDALLEVGNSNGEEISDSQYIFYDAASSFCYLYAWYLFYKNKEDNSLICDYVACKSMNLFCEAIQYSKTTGFLDGFFYKKGIPLLSFMATHRLDIARLYYPYFTQGLKNFDVAKAKKLKPQKMIVLAIEMLASEQKQTINWETFGIPSDRFYTQFVKEALYTQNEVLLKEWLTALCDNHLKWSARTETTEDEYARNGYEIEDRELLLWPFEYQAVKNFRAEHGLSTPEIDHPLLKTPLAIDHRPDFSRWNAPEWFYPLLDKLIAINPELAFTKTLFK
ncbi:hypothetical protein WKP56_000109 [Escherichia coli]|uniref:Uncharacterized protein n=2 Tax=Enterobacteriaceae TaxID=543 RepID=A0A4T8JGU6_ECOLX|nr:hypothetical protein [Escherichia coli]EHQ5576195.1 hypothetical protein [Escherichia coli O2]EGO7491473.1 hypothetical protein [Escherichia coli]EGO7971597.1 hypothetical protein [Escherichia coli]EGO7977256.1 hypothetical protein [Escherichia coli]